MEFKAQSFQFSAKELPVNLTPGFQAPVPLALFPGLVLTDLVEGANCNLLRPDDADRFLPGIQDYAVFSRLGQRLPLQLIEGVGRSCGSFDSPQNQLR